MGCTCSKSVQASSHIRSKSTPVIQQHTTKKKPNPKPLNLNLKFAKKKHGRFESRRRSLSGNLEYQDAFLSHRNYKLEKDSSKNLNPCENCKKKAKNEKLPILKTKNVKKLIPQKEHSPAELTTGRVSKRDSGQPHHQKHSSLQIEKLKDNLLELQRQNDSIISFAKLI